MNARSGALDFLPGFLQVLAHVALRLIDGLHFALFDGVRDFHFFELGSRFARETPFELDPAPSQIRAITRGCLNLRVV